MQISVVHADEFKPLREDLIELLEDAVASGANVGFLPPLSREEAADYWQSVEHDVRNGQIVLLVARDERGVLGSVQLILPAKASARHRAEVRKLLVHRRARRRGLGRGLMQAAEVQAAAIGRTLLFLDTRKGDAAEKLYANLGYQKAGEVPRFARSANGELHAAVFYYRELLDNK